MAAIFELTPTRAHPRAIAHRKPGCVPADLAGSVRRWAAPVVLALVATTVAGTSGWLPSPWAPAEPDVAASGRLVVVGPGDTLWSIAEKHFPASQHRRALDALAALNGPPTGVELGDVVALPRLD